MQYGLGHAHRTEVLGSLHRRKGANKYTLHMPLFVVVFYRIFREVRIVEASEVPKQDQT